MASDVSVFNSIDLSLHGFKGVKLMQVFFAKWCRLFVVFFISVFFISCATTTTRVSEDAMQAISSVDVYIGHPQQPLVYQRAVKGAKTGAVIAGMMGILVAEVISMGVNSRWEASGQKVAQDLSDYDHIAALEYEIRSYFDSAGVGYRIHRSPALNDVFARPEKIEEILEASTADAVVVLSYNYQLQQGFNLQLSGLSEVYAVSEEAQRFADERKVIVNRMLDHIELLEKDSLEGETPEQLAEAIIDSDSAIIRQSLSNAGKQAAASVATLLGIESLGGGEKYSMR
jgi:hypothetical protein